MKTVFDFLRAVERRPGMYLGGPDPDMRVQLRTLQWVLVGYECALSAHGIDPEGQRFSAAFGEYLLERFGWSRSQGPIAAVIAHTSAEEAWDTFWRLVREFEGATAPS